MDETSEHHEYKESMKMDSGSNMAEGITLGRLLDRDDCGCHRGYGYGDGFGMGGGIWPLFLFALLGGRGFGFGGHGDGHGCHVNGIELLNDAISTNATRSDIAIKELATMFRCDIGDVKKAICDLDKNLALVDGKVGYEAERVRNAVHEKACELKGAIADAKYTSAVQHAEVMNGLCKQSHERAMMEMRLNEKFCAIESREKDLEIRILRDKLEAHRYNDLHCSIRKIRPTVSVDCEQALLANSGGRGCGCAGE